MGAFSLAFLPNMAGIAGYVLSIIVLTPGYPLFQAANNTATLAEVSKDRRGTVSSVAGFSFAFSICFFHLFFAAHLPHPHSLKPAFPNPPRLPGILCAT